jgi:hypothetical protein
MINLPLFITFYKYDFPFFISFFKYDLSPFIYYILQIWFISLYLFHFTNMIYLPLFITFYNIIYLPLCITFYTYYPHSFITIHILSPFIYLRNIWNCWTGYAI